MKIHPLWPILLLLLLAGEALAQDAGEAARIRHLIGSVEALPGVMFLRNGGEYDSRQAADHLRRKLARAGSRVQTAEDFIRLCASRSSVSGEAYRLRFPDGRIVEAERFFRERLKEYAAGPI
jgi:hypothetical protein